MPSFIGFRLFLLPEVRFTTKKMPDLLLVVKQVTDLRNLIIFVLVNFRKSETFYQNLSTETMVR